MKPPLFWHRPPARPGPVSAALLPLAVLWTAAARRRLSGGARVRIGVPVVCIGNATLGGTGKTPTVIEVVRLFREVGTDSHVLSKGYGGSLRGPERVQESAHAADEVGDEPLLHAAFAPTWVAKDRLAGARAVVAAGAGSIVMDDGFQNPALRTDLSVMVVDAGAGFGNGRVFPAGPLREPVADALGRADFVLSVGSDGEHRRLLADWPVLATATILRGSLEPLGTGMDWSGQRVFAFAGIGRPARFFATLRAVGADVAGVRSFADHGSYSDAVLARLETEAARLDAQLVTTEKDAVRLPARFRQRVLTLPVRMVFLDDQPLRAALEDLAKRRPAPGNGNAA